MPILIACSPSTGSSLLRRILNRHSKIYCGPETSLLAKNDFYSNWDAIKDQFSKDEWSSLVNVGWHHMTGVNLLDENDLSLNDIRSLIEKSIIFKDFVVQYFDQLLQIENKSIWAEKTPSNAFAINNFLGIFPCSKIIHVTRHPLDAIASLISRGMTIYNAIAVYLLNTSQCLEHHNASYYHLIKYEDLVLEPNVTLQKLLQFLELNYEDEMLVPSQNEKGVDHMSGWKYKETENIGKASLDRYSKLSIEQKELIRMGVFSIAHNLEGENSSISDVCNTLGYELDVKPFGNNSMYFKKEMVKDKAKRLLKRSYFGVNNYPIILK